MVGDGGEKDPENDGHRAQEARGEHQREDLRLVADLGEANNNGRHEESFHKSAVRVGREISLGTAPSRPTQVQGTDAKGLAKPLEPPVPWPRAKHVDTDPPRNAGGYSPMTKDF